MIKIFSRLTAGKGIIITFWAVFFSTTLFAADSSLENLQNGLDELIYQLSRSVVTIEARAPVAPFYSDNTSDEAVNNLISTGIVFDSAGNILAVASSVIGRSQIIVKFNNQIIPASLKAVDYQSGLAVLQTSKHFNKPVEIKRQYGCAGQMVLALGNAFGLNATPSLGFCAGIRPDGIMQFTAPVTSGTLGGGLFNLSGQLVGIITGGIGQGNQSEIGLAIPAHQIPEIVTYLMANGDRPAGYLGLTTAEIEITPPIKIRYPTQLAKSFNQDLIIDKGLVITNVVPYSPAARAGLRYSDLLFSVSNYKIVSATELANLVRQSTPGTIIELGVLRHNRPFYVQVKTGKRKLNPYQPVFTRDVNPQRNQPLKDSLLKEIQNLKQAILYLENRVKQLK